MSRRAIALAGALVALSLVAPAAASAHAVLQSSTPQRGATLASQPRQVVLLFSESVEGNFGALRVFDARSRRVDDGRTIHPGGDSRRLAVDLKPGLARGTYVATYRVVSADSHPISGGLVFSIGAPGDAATPTVDELIGTTDAGSVTETAFGVVRGANLLATALLLGGLAFMLAVWLPARRGVAGEGKVEDWDAATTAFTARLLRLLLGAACVGVLCAVAGLVLQGATAAGKSAWSALDPEVMGNVLGTRFGEVWAARGVAFAALGLIAAWLALRAARERSAPSAPLLALAAVPAAVIALGPALAGHAGVTSPVALSVGLNVGHVLAMSAWVGGLVMLVAVLPAATRRLEGPDRTRLLATALVRFSAIALACVAVLLVTGTLQAFEHIDMWSSLLDTGFGRAVAIKAVLLIVLIGVAAINRRRVVPRLRALAEVAAVPGAAGRLLRRMLRAEVALVVVVLAVTAALVSYPPPASLAGGPFGASTELGPLRMEVTVDPARVGTNEAHLYLLTAADGTPFSGTKELTATFSLPEQDIAEIDARARAAGPGHYVIDTVALLPGGDWRLRVTSRVSEFDQYEATVKVPVR